MWNMIWLELVLCALLIFRSGCLLSKYGDVIADKTGERAQSRRRGCAQELPSQSIMHRRDGPGISTGQGVGQGSGGPYSIGWAGHVAAGDGSNKCVDWPHP